MPKPVKPSPAQLAFLRSLPSGAYTGYPPAMKCVERGWAKPMQASFGHAKFEITSDGQAVVDVAKEKQRA